MVTKYNFLLENVLLSGIYRLTHFIPNMEDDSPLIYAGHVPLDIKFALVLLLPGITWKVYCKFKMLIPRNFSKEHTKRVEEFRLSKCSENSTCHFWTIRKDHHPLE